MGVLDLNKDGRVDGKDVVYALKGVVVPVVLPMAEEAVTDAITNEVLEGKEEWRQSGLNTVDPAMACSAATPVAIKALSLADRKWFVDLVAGKYEREVAAKPRGIVKSALSKLASALGVQM